MSKLAGRSLLFAALAVPIAMLAGPLTASADSEPVQEDTTISRVTDPCCPDGDEIEENVHIEDVNINHNVNGIYEGNTDANVHVHDHWWFASLGGFDDAQASAPGSFDSVGGTPADALAQPSTDALTADSPVEGLVGNPADSPVDSPVESLVGNPAGSPVDSPADSAPSAPGGIG